MLVEMLGGEAEVEGDYPAWEYRMDSALRPQVEKVYEELFHKNLYFPRFMQGWSVAFFLKNSGSRLRFFRTGQF